MAQSTSQISSDAALHLILKWRHRKTVNLTSHGAKYFAAADSVEKLGASLADAPVDLNRIRLAAHSKPTRPFRGGLVLDGCRSVQRELAIRSRFEPRHSH